MDEKWHYIYIYCNPKSNGKTIRPAKHSKRIWSTWQPRVLICYIEVRLCFDLWLCFSDWVSWSFIKSILPFEAWLSSPIAACSEGNLTKLNGAYFQESQHRVSVLYAIQVYIREKHINIISRYIQQKWTFWSKKNTTKIHLFIMEICSLYKALWMMENISLDVNPTLWKFKCTQPKSELYSWGVEKKIFFLCSSYFLPTTSKGGGDFVGCQCTVHRTLSHYLFTFQKKIPWRMLDIYILIKVNKSLLIGS